MSNLVNSGPREKSVRFMKIFHRFFPFSLEGDWDIKPTRRDLLLSVIIPTHTRVNNQLPFSALETCLLSLSEQTVPKKSLEVIVIEDGPLSSKTLDTIKAFEEDLPITHVPADSVHRPRGWLRNLGLQHSQGQWILMVDDDTLLGSYFLKNLFLILKQLNPERDFILPHGIPRYGLLDTRWDFIEDYSLATDCIIYPRPLLEKIRGFHSPLDRFEDIDLAIRAYLSNGQSLKAGKIQFFNPPLFIPLNSPISRERARPESDAYRYLRRVYSFPFWLALILKEILKLPYLMVPSSREKRTFATLAWYNLLGIFTFSKPKKADREAP